MCYSSDSATTTTTTKRRVGCLVAGCRKLVLDVQLLVSPRHAEPVLHSVTQ
jgi:hypothetical protein